jgi:hypothetical protein
MFVKGKGVKEKVSKRCQKGVSPGYCRIFAVPSRWPAWRSGWRLMFKASSLHCWLSGFLIFIHGPLAISKFGSVTGAGFYWWMDGDTTRNRCSDSTGGQITAIFSQKMQSVWTDSGLKEVLQRRALWLSRPA